MDNFKYLFALFLFIPIFGFTQTKSLSKNQEPIEVDSLLKAKSKIISILPLVYDGVYNNPAGGIGASFEKQNNKKLSFYIPLHFFIYDKLGISTSPTLKFYPFGFNKNVCWSIGPALRLSRVIESGNYYDENSGKAIFKTLKRNYAGLEVHNGLNVFVDNFSLSVAASSGITFLPHSDYIRFVSLGIGYRF